MFFSRKLVRRILGVLWLIDGLLQLQPQMFTANMINGVLQPMLQGQPAPVAANLQVVVTMIGQHLILFNLLIAIVQVEIGLFLICGLWIRATVIISVVWALVVWYAGEGMNMLLTGQSSILSGAPGAVLLYPLLGLLLYPRTATAPGAGQATLLSPTQFRRVLAGFWIFAALLQFQPYWWQPGRISGVMSDLIGLGGINRVLLDPALQRFSLATAGLEIPLNLVLIEIFLVMGLALAVVKQERARPWLLASLTLSLLIWWMFQGFGMLFTGLATDVNSGLLLVLMALACWPGTVHLRVLRQPVATQKIQPQTPVVSEQLA